MLISQHFSEQWGLAKANGFCSIFKVSKGLKGKSERKGWVFFNFISIQFIFSTGFGNGKIYTFYGNGGRDWVGELLWEEGMDWVYTIPSCKIFCLLGKDT